VNAPATLAEPWLGAPMAAFLASHPAVRLDLRLSDRFVDLVEEGVDVVLRVSARLRDSSLGVAVLPSFAVATDLAAGRLAELLAPFSFIRLGIHALHTPARVVPANVRAFVDALAVAFRTPPWRAP
jgi:DNA-binding transcriptional LysR family regulator